MKRTRVTSPPRSTSNRRRERRLLQPSLRCPRRRHRRSLRNLRVPGRPPGRRGHQGRGRAGAADRVAGSAPRRWQRLAQTGTSPSASWTRCPRCGGCSTPRRPSSSSSRRTSGSEDFTPLPTDRLTHAAAGGSSPGCLRGPSIGPLRSAPVHTDRDLPSGFRRPSLALIRGNMSSSTHARQIRHSARPVLSRRVSPCRAAPRLTQSHRRSATR